MVNYKRIVCEVAVLLAVVALTSGAPAPDCTEGHYDQRQNGTENYRVNIDGVVIAIAPAESLLDAIADFTGQLDVSDLEELLLKPPPAPSSPSSTAKPEISNDTKPEPEKPVETILSDVSLTSETKAQKKDASEGKKEKAQRLKHRLASALLPLLRRTRHH